MGLNVLVVMCADVAICISIAFLAIETRIEKEALVRQMPSQFSFNLGLDNCLVMPSCMHSHQLVNDVFDSCGLSRWNKHLDDESFLVLVLVVFTSPHSPTRLERGASMSLLFAHMSRQYCTIPRKCLNSLTLLSGLNMNSLYLFCWGLIPPLPLVNM